jgi:hypothetical protein
VILGASINTLSHSGFFQGTEGEDFAFLQSLLLEALFFFWWQNFLTLAIMF